MARTTRIGMVAVAATFVVTALAPGIPASSAATGDWPTYLSANGRSGFNPAETTITASTAGSLNVHWKIHVSGSPDAISAQPVVANSVIYWGAWDGLERATTLAGKRVWPSGHANLGQTNDSQCNPPITGVASTATVTGTSSNNSVVYVGGGNDRFYALNAKNGSVIWSTSLGSSPSHFIWSSAAVYNGSVYIGNSSFGDCPLVAGQLYQLEASTGVVQHVFNTVPSGCTGGGVWGSPTIDAANGTLYFVTGNPGSCSSATPYTEAIVEVNASDLSLVGHWQARGSDNLDLDFGSTPTLFQAGTTPMVGVSNKDGTFYAFQRGALGSNPVWQDQVSTSGSCPQCGTAELSPAAWDGHNLYVASENTTINGVSCAGSLRELDPSNGSFVWQTCLQDGPVLGAVSAVPGVAFVGAGTHFVGVDTSSGGVLFDYNTGANIWGAASISNGVAYVGNQGGTLFAFGR